MRPQGRLQLLGALALTTALATSGCGTGDGIASALEVDGFASCVEAAGVATPEGERSAEEQLAFWGEPGTLECAVEELTAEQRSDALEGAFVEDTVAGSEEQDEQRQALADWARRSAEQRGLETTLADAEELLASTWVAGADDVTATNSLAGALVAGAMRGSGGLDSWDAVRAADPSAAESATAQIRYVADGPAPDGTGPTAEEYRSFYAFRDDLVDAVRG